MRKKFKKNHGAGLLIIMVSVAIMLVALVYFMNPKPAGEALSIQQQEPEKYPWVESKRFCAKGRLPEQPGSDQPAIAEETLYTGDVYDANGQGRGSIGLLITPDGFIKAEWGGSYHIDSSNCDMDIMDSMAKGNIDPTKQDTSGEKPRLYTLTQGNFTNLETNNKSGKVRKVGGYLYTTGWLDHENCIKGYLSITSDRDTVFVYEYTARKTVLPKFKLPAMLNH